MKKVLVLGAGLVARPLVRHLLEVPEIEVTVASRTVSKAEKLIDGHPDGTAIPLDVKDDEALRKLVAEHDLTISLLPYIHHEQVARHCLEYGKDLINTSYVQPALQAMSDEVERAGLLFLNECGLDPGIDHMAAMKIIDEVRKQGGKVTGFRSYCGGLPAPEHNDNPLGYKFSWSPSGVLLAGRNAAKYLEDGKLVDIPGEELFDHHWEMTIGDLELEAYPNRDSMPYQELYGLDDATTMFRGTLRYPGWSVMMRNLVKIGYLTDEVHEEMSGKTYRDLIAGLAGVPGEDLEAELADSLGIAADSETMKRFEWLGLLTDRPLDPDSPLKPIEQLGSLMVDQMAYKEGEKDMVVQHHEFDIEVDGRKELRTSTLFDFGVPHGDSSMSRTVSLPAAMAAKLMVQGRIAAKGVKIPVEPEIYEPILTELETLGIEFVEKTTSR
ncbi:MAG: saccharopine dehydrogenase [Acidobacteria bacterium]|nr:MAG: saccharopine dehydrogenase [Acidobacteriota bacterium]